jgi:hypothetical protein
MRWTCVIAIATTGCVERSLIDEGVSGGSRPVTSAALDDDGDAPEIDESSDGGEQTGSGEPPDCSDHGAPEVTVSVLPAPAPGEDHLLELQCTIVRRSGASPGPVSFALDCADAAGHALDEPVGVTVEAALLEVPAALSEGAAVEARIQAWRHADIERHRSDHFVLLQDGEVVLAAGAGYHDPFDENGDDASREFWAPLNVTPRPTGCFADSVECHEPRRGEIEVVNGEDALFVPDFSYDALPGYAVHTGTVIAGDSPACGEPPLGWFAFAVARL